MKKNILRRALTRLLLQTSAYKLIPAYDYVQNTVEYYLHEYLGRTPASVSNIFIVGGYKGHEISRILKEYQNCNITVFEPSLRYKNLLSKKFKSNSRVEVIQMAVSDQIGETTFYETNLRGSGSLLPVGELAQEIYGTKQAEKFNVPTTTIDTILGGGCLDCLWVDVQGAEHLVLKGAKHALERIDSIFIEVSRLPNLYEGSVTMKQLESELTAHGFESILVGLDAANLTGNAFYIRAPSQTRNFKAKD